MIVALIFSSLFAYVLWTSVCLEINVRKARALQVPVVWIPVSEDNTLWVIFQPLLWALLRRCIPIQWHLYPTFIRFAHRNWNFLEKSRPISQLGPVWVMASPSGVSLHVADADTIEKIFSRWRQFTRPNHKYKMLAIYGPSVFTVPLDDWPHHRKAIAAPFSEDLMKSVWEEALSETQKMLHRWTTMHQKKVLSLDGDLGALTFNVLAAVALQKPRVLTGDVSHSDSQAHAQTITKYRDTLHVVLKNAILLMLIPYRHLMKSGMPRGLAEIGSAAASFESILTDIVAEETAALDQDSEGSNGILTPLVRATRSEASSTRGTVKDTDASHKNKKGGLSVKEILGNVFAINFAGHDTVLIALTSALSLLAADLSVQAWLKDEITAVFGGNEGHQGWDYSNFSRLHRCRAVFLETLRLYAPITGVPKVVTGDGTSLCVGGQTIHIPPKTDIFPMLLGMQTNKQFWGTDAEEWRPSRWILHPGVIADEELLVPRKGVFFPWSEGLQNCVGKSFSIVEAVAMLARIFHRHRLLPKLRGGETEVEARQRLRDCVNDVNYNLLLRMNHPEDIELECIPEDG